MALLVYQLFDNTLSAWLLAGGLGLLTFLILWAARALALQHTSRLASRPGRQQRGSALAAAMLARSHWWLLALFSLSMGANALALPLRAAQWLDTLGVIAFLTQAGAWGSALISEWLERQTPAGNGDRESTLAASAFLLRLALFAVITILVLNNIPGIQVTALITSLGVGGIVIALAVQNILADLFASLSIALDRPFVVGDFISVDTYEGTVEKIGMKTTRVRSLSGEELIFANNDLLRSRLRNYRRMGQRRAVFAVGLPRPAAPEQAAALPAAIKEAIEAQTLVRFERAHLREAGGPCLVFEAVYFVLSPSYDLYMDTQQAINLALLTRFPELNLTVKIGAGAIPC